MPKESKLYLLRDRKDYVKKLTNDNVVNVIGTKYIKRNYKNNVNFLTYSA